MAAHVGNCVAKATALGDLVAKDKRSSPRKIDAAVACIVAFERTAWHQARRGKATSGRRVIAL
jgi:phage terminase large subunit-like protein